LGELDIATNFVMFEPIMADQLAMKTNRSKVLYNDDAIYISAIMYDNEPKKFRETKGIFLGIRSFSVYINGFNDGQQDYRFM
jgi:hypothetical protein